MAQQVHTIHVTDLTGQELARTVRPSNSVSRTGYEIDLSQHEADEFATTVQKYTSAARRVGGRRQSGSALQRLDRS